MCMPVAWLVGGGGAVLSPVFGVDLPTACVAHVNPLNFSVQTNLLVNQPLILHPRTYSARC